ncbi:hypothetical protein MMPV_007998 [Pyropia vietnamensis]
MSAPPTIGRRGRQSTGAVAAPLPASAARPRMAAAPPTPDDLYAVLGVPSDADGVAIKRAYRRRALENHPDVSKAPDAKERFLAIQTAYATLSDNAKRREYDRRRARGGGVGGASWDEWAAGVADAARGAASAGAARGGVDGGVFSDEYWRRWRAANPGMKDIDDSWGAVLGDLFSGLSGTVSGGVGAGAGAGKGLLDDFIEFLERTVDGFDRGSTGSSSRAGSGGTSSRQSGGGSGGAAAAAGGDYTDEMLEEVLASGDPDVLASELDDTRFILTQLRSRAAQLRNAAADADRRVRRTRSAAAAAGEGSDAAARSAAATAEAARIRSRLADVDSYIARQGVRERKLSDALSASRVSRMQDAQAARAKEVDDELERMRKELGM